jgi:hypothetical protein
VKNGFGGRGVSGAVGEIDSMAIFRNGVDFGKGSEVILGPGDVGVNIVVIVEFVGVVSLAGKCSAMGFVLEGARHGKWWWSGGRC